MFDYRLKKDNFINNKYIAVFYSRRTIKYQISDDYCTKDYWYGGIITNIFLLVVKFTIIVLSNNRYD